MIRFKEMEVWFCTTFTILSVAWFGDSIHTIVTSYSNWKSIDWTMLIVSSILYSLFSYRLYKLSTQYLRPVHQVHQASETKKKVIVFFASINKYKLVLEKDKILITEEINSKDNNEDKSKERVTILALDGKSVSEDIDMVDKKKNELKNFNWNWQQVLRGLKPHLDTVTDVYVLFTKSAKKKPIVEAKESVENEERNNQSEECDDYVGSFHQKHDFLCWLKRYFSNTNVSVHQYHKDIDNKDISGCYQIFNDLIDELDRKGHKDEDIVFDITGGTAGVSAAASMATLHNKLSFQHIDQNEFEPRSYNLEVHLGHGNK